MKSDFTKKIASYTGLATSVLLIQKNANAQIVYSNPPDIILNGYGASTELDLNNDGVSDISFKIDDHYPYASYQGGFITLNNINGGSPMSIRAVDYPCVTGASGQYMALALMANTPIKGNNYRNWASLSYDFLFNNDSYYGSTNCQQWLGVQNRYLGFRFRDDSGGGNNFFYGWMRLSVNQAGTKMIIKDWAVNFNPNQGILAGQMFRVGIDEEQAAHEIPLMLYTYGKTLTIDNNILNAPLQISVYNELGQAIRVLETDEASSTFQLDGISPGIYIVRVNSLDKSFTEEVLIQ